MKKHITILFTMLFIITSAEYSQETGEDNLGSWAMFFGNAKITDRISVSPEIQYRTYEVGSNFNQLLIRNGFNWHLSDKATATLGYGFISTDGTFEEPNGEKNTTEHRLYGQFSLKNVVGKIQFSHRYRLEQRFINNPTSGNDTQYRARYLLRLTYPINETWYVSAYDEVFINLQEPIFSQNRLYTSVGYKWSKNLRTELGYLKNHFTGINFDRLQLGFWYSLDLRNETSNNNKANFEQGKRMF